MNSNLLEEFMKDTVAVPMGTELTELSDLAQRQLFLEGRVSEIEHMLDETKEQLRMVQEVHIPETMAAIGMKEFKLANGYKLSIKEDVFASIRKDFTNQAVQWLDNKGLGDIVKDEVSVKFGRGEFDNVESLIEYCNSHNMNATEKLSVHPQTLKATVKEQLAKGIEFPEEFFSVGPVRKAIIKK